MKDLIVVSKQTINEEEVNAVDARELHEFLESKIRFNDWIKRRIEKYDFTEGIDFITILNKEYSPPRKEYTLSLDMAKELSMVENNEKGKQARKYFISCEKKLKEIQTAFEIPKTLPFALRAYADEVEKNEQLLIENKKHKITTRKLRLKSKRQTRKIRKDKPKVEYFEKVLNSSSDFTITQIAKEAEMTGISLNMILEREGVQFKQSGQWMLTKKYHGCGLARIRTYITDDGKTRHNTVWTEKGRKFILNLLENI